MLIVLLDSSFSQDECYSVITYSLNFTKLSSFGFLQIPDSLLPPDLQNPEQIIREEKNKTKTYQGL